MFVGGLDPAYEFSQRRVAGNAAQFDGSGTGDGDLQFLAILPTRGISYGFRHPDSQTIPPLPKLRFHNVYTKYTLCQLWPATSRGTWPLPWNPPCRSL